MYKKQEALININLTITTDRLKKYKTKVLALSYIIQLLHETSNKLHQTLVKSKKTGRRTINTNILLF